MHPEHLNNPLVERSKREALLHAAPMLDRAIQAACGAIEEDHRQLRVLEDDTNQTVVLIDRLSKELNADIARQQSYVASERANLSVLSSSVQAGQLYGSGAAGLSAAPALS